MAESIYPTFNLPSVTPDEDTTEEKIYLPSFDFDFSTGDFVRDGANRLVLADGKEAYIQWCLKQCVTERFTKLAYSDSVGVEIQSAIKNEIDIEAVESIIQRTITEALMVNKATEYVRDFEFGWNGSDSLTVSFTVKGKQWLEDETLTVSY